MALSSANRPILQLRLIGQMQAWTINGDDICPPGRQTCALLAVLALSVPRPAPRASLVGLLYSRLPDMAARAALRSEIVRLTDALAPAAKDLLEVTRFSLALRPDAAWVDVLEVMQATEAAPGALSLLDGTLLDGMDGIDPAFDQWLKQQRDRLYQHASDVAQTHLQAQTEPGAIILAAHRLLLVDPVHEGGWRALMQGYAAQGERGMATEAYEQCRTALATRLDTVPSEATRSLLADILYQEPVRPGQPWPAPMRDHAPAPFEAASMPLAYQRQTWRRVGVLPMRCYGLTDDETFFGPGLASQITGALSRFFQTIVIAPDRLARVALDDADEAVMRHAFGVDYLIDGIIRRGRGKLRVTFHLMDLHAGGRIVWVDGFNRADGDLKSLSNAVAAEVVARIEPELWLVDALRNTARPPANATPKDLLLRSIPPIAQMDRDQFMQAGEYLARANRLAPEFPAVLCWYAFWHLLLISQGWAQDPAQALALGAELADRAVVLNPLGVRALAIAGLLRAQRRPHEAVELYDRALQVNPYLAMAWALSAVNYLHIGDLAGAERRFGTYKALAPRHRLAFIFDAFFVPIHLIKRDYQAALSHGQAAIQLNPRFTAGYKPYLAALGHLGQQQEAASVLQRLRSIEPDFSIARFFATTSLRDPAELDHFAAGLRLAGVP